MTLFLFVNCLQFYKITLHSSQNFIISKNQRMLITMWWKAWSGKGTVSKLLAKELWYEIVSIWDMKRELAAEMWINIIEFNKMWDDPEKSAEFDLKYEEYQKNLKLTDNIILDSRLGFYAQPKAFKILLDVDEEIAWERIFKAERTTDKHATKKHAINEVKERNSSDEARYQKLYNVDLRDPNNYNLVIDTSERTPEEVLKIILEEYRIYKWKHQIAETPEEKKTLRKAKAKTKLLKDIALLLALILMTCWWLFSIVNEQKKTQLRTTSETVENSEVEEVIENLE